MKQRAWRRAAAVVGVAAATLVACGDDDEDAAPTSLPQAAAPGARADLVDGNNQAAGEVTFTEEGGKVVVEGKLRGLPPGFHGFHVHAVGRCEPPFTSAAGHLEVGAQDHPAHAGDMPALLVAGDGTAETRFSTDRYKLADLLDADGQAVIIHASADNYGNVPTRYAPAVDQTTKDTGDAGGRVACGVIKRP